MKSLKRVTIQSNNNEQRNPLPGIFLITFSLTPAPGIFLYCLKLFFYIFFTILRRISKNYLKILHKCKKSNILEASRYH